VDAAVAREVLEALSPAEVEERARQAVKGVISKEGVPRDPRTRERLVRRLLRLGFSGPVVAKVLAGMPEASSADEGGTEW
jgi:SOS response regulatory protein OraA/RecX